jgi:sec-independent protein translocase protein TatA
MKLGAMEIGIIVLIILIVFGVGRLPQIGSSLGKGIRAFKKESTGTAEEPESEPEPETAIKPRRKTAARKKRAGRAAVKTEKAVKSEKEEPATSAG